VNQPPTRLIVGSDAETIGREARRLVDDGTRVAVFVGDPEADADAIDEFVADVVRA
jgi:hypothetical protein